MDGLPEEDDTHACNFIISADDVKLCQTCNRPDPATREYEEEPTITPRELQQPGNDKNSVNIQKTKTMVTEVAPRVAFVGTGKTGIDLATSRAEHRRRQKAEDKRDMTPRLLSVERTDMNTKETRTVFKSYEQLVGPGLFVMVGTPLKKARPCLHRAGRKESSGTCWSRPGGGMSRDPRPATGHKTLLHRWAGSRAALALPASSALVAAKLSHLVDQRHLSVATDRFHCATLAASHPSQICPSRPTPISLL